MKRCITIFVIQAAAFTPMLSAATAHGGADDGETFYSLDAWILVPLATISILYAIGTYRLNARDAPRAWRQHLLFWGGVVLTAVILLGPLHGLGEQSLTFHMVEHELLMVVAAPLLVLAKPVGTIIWSFPRLGRKIVGGVMVQPLIRKVWDWATHGTVATVTHGLAIWIWHIPFLFNSALANIAMHRLQHLSFFGTAIIFWWALIRKSEPGGAAWHLFVTMVHMSLLGALMALAPRVLYQTEALELAKMGLTPLMDQQLAGIIMWIPAGLIYAAGTMWALALWIRSSTERKSGNV